MTELNLAERIQSARGTERLILELRDIAAELADDLRTGDRAFWLWVDPTELQKAYKALEYMRSNIEDERAGLKGPQT